MSLYWCCVSGYSCKVKYVNKLREQYNGSFHFLDQSFTETTLWSQSRVQKLTNQCSAEHCSLHNVITDVIVDISIFFCLFVTKRKSEVIFIHQRLIINPLTYLVHAESTDELISFGFSNCSVRSLVSVIALSESLSPNKKKQLQLFGWSLVSVRALSERLIQMTHCVCISVCTHVYVCFRAAVIAYVRA